MIARVSPSPSARPGSDYRVIQARYAGGYRVWLRFRDGTAGVVDLGAELNGEVFEPLRDVRLFQDFYVDAATIAWRNGADLAPEYLYDRVAAVPGNSALARALRRWRDWVCGVLVTTVARSPAILPAVPEVSRFLGIRILMRYNDHTPPHFHAEYGEHNVMVFIESGEIRGEFPVRARGFVTEWLAQHHRELLENWQRARTQKPLRAIAPLE